MANDETELARLHDENQRMLRILSDKGVISDEVTRTRKLNDILRKVLAESDLDCIYCGLAKADMVKCHLGFPGCGRADDLVV